MKIIHVSYDASPYGTTTLLIDLLNTQKKIYGETNLALAFHAAHKDIYKFEEIGIPVFCLGRNTARDIRLIFGFFKLFKNFDIVNLHTPSPWAFLAALFARKKVVFTFHGALGMRKSGNDWLFKNFYKIFFNRYCHKITFASKSSFNRYIQGIGYEPKKNRFVLFPYGIRVSSVKTQRPRELVRNSLDVNSKFVVGTAARMDPMKRIDRLIDAFVYLSGYKDIELLIAGSGDDDYKAKLLKQVEKFQLQDRIRFLGYREDMLDVINTFDLFVLPSRDEPFGIALLEAMLLGIPSVVFNDGGGTVDILGKSGFIVNNSKELSDAILKIKDDKVVREAITLDVQKRALKFDMEHTAQNFHCVYSSLIGK